MCDSSRKGTDMEDEQEEVARVRDWVGRLEGFISTLDGLDGETPSDFCESACDAWKNIAMVGYPLPTSPAILIIVESFAALAKVLTTVSMDWADTPDCRDRLTRNDVQQLVNDALDGICRDARRWLSEGLPSDDEVKQRAASAGAGVSAALDAHETVRSTTVASRVLLHRLHTVLRAGLRLVSLTDSDDFAVARLEPESVLAALILVDFELARHRCSPIRRGLQDEGNANCLGGVLRGLRPYL